MSTANEVREYVNVAIIKPARRRGLTQIRFTSNDVHQGMGLRDRFPLVCSSIDANKFLEFASLELIKRDGPKQSSTVSWTFELK